MKITPIDVLKKEHKKVKNLEGLLDGYFPMWYDKYK